MSNKKCDLPKGSHRTAFKVTDAHDLHTSPS